MNLPMSLHKLNVREQLVLNIFWFSLNTQSAALFPIVIPLQLLLFVPRGQIGNAQQAALLGRISAVGAVVSLILPPVFGMISDNTTSRFGRLRPYIATCTTLQVLSPLYNFMLVFIIRFAVMIGLTLFMTFIEYYFANVAHVTNFVQATAGVAVLSLVGTICSTFVLGVFSDRTRRAPIVCISTVFMAMASLAFVIAPDGFPLWTLGFLFGVGYGAYTSVDWALAIDSMPSLDSIGKDMGIWEASNNLPAIIAPALGGLIISLVSIYVATALGYHMIFAVTTIFLLFAAGFVLKIRI